MKEVKEIEIGEYFDYCGVIYRRLDDDQLAADNYVRAEKFMFRSGNRWVLVSTTVERFNQYADVRPVVLSVEYKECQ